jgi:hypothetical protein
MTDVIELHVEQLIGRVVRDASGVVLGRIEEMATQMVDGELVVTEFHLGPQAMVERIAGFALMLPFLNRLRRSRRTYKIDSLLMDLSVPDRPRVLAEKSALNSGLECA